MKDRIKWTLPYVSLTKTWLTNLSVATFAVGLVEENTLGVWIGLSLLVFAFLIAFFEEKVKP